MVLLREYYHFSSTWFCCLLREYYYFSSTLLRESCHRKSKKGVHALPLAIPLHRKVCKKLKSAARTEQQSRTFLQSSYLLPTMLSTVLQAIQNKLAAKLACIAAIKIKLLDIAYDEENGFVDEETLWWHEFHLNY